MCRQSFTGSEFVTRTGYIGFCSKDQSGYTSILSSRTPLDSSKPVKRSLKALSDVLRVTRLYQARKAGSAYPCLISSEYEAGSVPSVPYGSFFKEMGRLGRSASHTRWKSDKGLQA